MRSGNHRSVGQEGVAAGFDGPRDSGAVQVCFYDHRPAQERARSMPPLGDLIFARQFIEVLGEADTSAAGDRVSPLLSALAELGGSVPWSSLEVLARSPGENEDLQRFVRRFASPWPMR